MEILLCLFFVLAIGALLFLLYQNGLLAAQCKSAILYVESLRGTRARFSSCNGKTVRRIKGKEDKAYQVIFDSQLTKGTVSMEILNSAKHPILCLDGATKSGTIRIEKGKRYFFLVHFHSATGQYTIDWKEKA